MTAGTDDDDRKGGPEAAEKLADQAKQDEASEGSEAGVDPDSEGGIGDDA